MRIFFVVGTMSDLADGESHILREIKGELLSFPDTEETDSINSADAIIIQEKDSFKNFRYINDLLADPLLSPYYHKVFTINNDDCATGLLRGIYTCLPKSRFDPSIYTAVPFFEYPNELIHDNERKHHNPEYLAAWRGNTKSNSIRGKMMAVLRNNSKFALATTDSWLNHGTSEKQDYISLIINAKFSLCPSGWAAVSFRIYESMALGRCPVILADDFVPPSGPEWKELALFLKEEELDNLPSFLLQHEQEYKMLGEKAFDAWTTYFGPLVIKKYYAQSLHSLICSSQILSREDELTRWLSWKLFWSNKWTIPQRVMNKIQKMSRWFKAG